MTELPSSALPESGYKGLISACYFRHPCGNSIHQLFPARITGNISRIFRVTVSSPEHDKVVKIKVLF